MQELGSIQVFCQRLGEQCHYTIHHVPPHLVMVPMHTRTPRNPRDDRSSSDAGFNTGQDDLSPDLGDDQHKELIESDEDQYSLTSSTVRFRTVSVASLNQERRLLVILTNVPLSGSTQRQLVLPRV